jgi:ABC-type lipoprotein export system ATPase subunit
MLGRVSVPEIQTPFAIEARGLSVVVDEVTLVGNIDFRVAPGEFVAIKGPSGSGKTTSGNAFYNLTIGKEPPTAGEVWYGDPEDGGVEIYSQLSLRERRIFTGQHVGYVPQMPMLWPELTVAQNISRVLAYKRVAYDTAYIGGIAVLLGIQDKMHQESGVLSGGEKQRASIIAALAHNPSALIMDEPTAAVNSDTKQEINSLLTKLSDETGKTIVVVTHEETSARRIIEMSSGRIVTSTSVNLARSGILDQ